MRARFLPPEPVPAPEPLPASDVVTAGSETTNGDDPDYEPDVADPAAASSSAPATQRRDAYNRKIILAMYRFSGGVAGAVMTRTAMCSDPFLKMVLTQKQPSGKSTYSITQQFMRRRPYLAYAPGCTAGHYVFTEYGRSECEAMLAT